MGRHAEGDTCAHAGYFRDALRAIQSAASFVG
jgi:hypothetical protein